MDPTVRAIHALYASFAYAPPHAQWTVLAAVVVTAPDADDKVISVATGTKCSPATRLSPRGESVHDCHAEVLARRAALRWLLSEALRLRDTHSSHWLVATPDGRCTLRQDARLSLYVSALPCGDASTRTLAALQDPAAAARMSSAFFPELAPGAASRGRDDYARLGVLRTKPGRADSPPTRCMACSDKLARWAALGVQGALGARVLAPVYLSSVIVGDVPPVLHSLALEDCSRAFSTRVGALDGAPHPRIYPHNPS